MKRHGDALKRARTLYEWLYIVTGDERVDPVACRELPAVEVFARLAAVVEDAADRIGYREMVSLEQTAWMLTNDPNGEVAREVQRFVRAVQALRHRPSPAVDKVAVGIGAALLVVETAFIALMLF